MEQLYCQYFQANLLREKIWFVVGALKSQENLCFDRALDKQTNLFEFFVPIKCVPEFLRCMHYFQDLGYLFNLEQKTNRVQLEGKI